MIIIMAFKFVNFELTAHTSQSRQLEQPNFFVERYNLHQWEAEPHATFPQELELELESRCEVAHVILQAMPEYDSIPEVQVYVGDQGNWRHGGSLHKITAYEQKVNVLGMGKKLKLIFPKPSNNHLSFCSVGLSLIRVWAQPVAFHQGVVNEATPLIAQQGRQDAIDKLLISNGKRVLTSGSVELRCDENTAITMREMEAMEIKAHKGQDYELLNQLTHDLQVVRTVS